MKIKYLPIGIDVEGRKVLLVGAGKVALRKVRVLLKTRASIMVVAPDIDPAIRAYALKQQLVLRQRRYRQADVRGACLVIAATNDRALNERVKTDANRLGILVNVVDVRDLCDCIFMSLIQHDGLVAAFSTDARVPGRSKELRLFLEKKIHEYSSGGN